MQPKWFKFDRTTFAVFCTHRNHSNLLQFYQQKNCSLKCNQNRHKKMWSNVKIKLWLLNFRTCIKLKNTESKVVRTQGFQFEVLRICNCLFVHFVVQFYLQFSNVIVRRTKPWLRHSYLKSLSIKQNKWKCSNRRALLFM